MLAEDNERDIELILAAMAEHKLANEVIVVRDGTEAFDSLSRRGEFAGRREGQPAVVLLDLNCPE